VAAVLVQLIVGEGAVGVDRVHEPVGEMLQVFGAAGLGELGQQPLPGRNLGRVKPGPVHLGQRPFDDRHLLRAHRPVSLRRRQTGPLRGQNLPQHADPFTAGFGGRDPAGRFPRGQS
jgi:hypothetical protein